ncbi:hypothetical protein [Nocardioides marmorisolisilvae]|uniref:LPXTG cell wall anchor domain-containing protein n=1 Tax=Nocardioides marmorisolisilvae TaxID=1542737 RepID=A0A3N0DV71_9ACTN|nr:hypothetical protein [Nocardioides marmorisolisilvae]RNL79522.1 hypothetical protein EFL95_11105 [Nocardioides marmorisolisilvae]
MNRSIKSLILAAGVAVAGMSITAPAHADGIPSGPGNLGTVQPGPVVDPKPQPKPVPSGPKDVVNPPKCTHGCGGNQGPEGPKDIAPAPDQEVTNGGPLVALDPEDDPAHNAPLDQGCFTGCDLPDEAAPTAKPTVVPALDSSKPSAADQLDRGEVLAPSANEDGGINPLLFVLGGAGAGALILAAVARRRRQQTATGAAI